MSELKNRIRHLRLARSWTQAELAQKAGTSAATVSRLEHESVALSTAWLERLASVFGLHPAELIETRGAPAIRLIGKVGADGRIAPSDELDIYLDLPAPDPIAVDVMEPQGPYRAGERLIGGRLVGASLINGVGRDCIVGLACGRTLLARVAGTPPAHTLIPAEPGSTILYGAEIAWLAPIELRILRVR